MQRLRMYTSNGLSRDPSEQSTTADGCGCGEPEHCGPGPFVTTSVTRDGALFVHDTDGSRSPDPDQHHSVPHGPSHRDPAIDVFHLLLTNHGAPHVQQYHDQRGPLAAHPDPIHTPGFNPWFPFYGAFISESSRCVDETYYRSETDGLRLSHSVSPPPTTDAELSLPHQPIHIYNPFPSYPNPASGEASIPRNDNPLIQAHHSARYVVFTSEQTHSNQTQLSSGSQGRPLTLIASENYDSIAQHFTSRNSQWDSHSPSPSIMWMTIVPQRPYRDNKNQESIVFRVNGRLGITAQDAIRKIYNGLDGRDDQVFVNKSSVFMLRLEWPEYPPWSRKMRVDDWKKERGRIKLAKLATDVSKYIERFIKGAQAIEQPDRVCSGWKVGPGCVGIDSLVLLSLDKVSRGSWQPRIGLLSREIDENSSMFVI